jgi:hypothetical protein
MIKDKKVLEDFNNRYIKNCKLTYEKKLKIYNSLLAEAFKLKVLPSKDPLEGIETDIEVARILNSLP